MTGARPTACHRTPSHRQCGAKGRSGGATCGTSHCHMRGSLTLHLYLSQSITPTRRFASMCEGIQRFDRPEHPKNENCTGFHQFYPPTIVAGAEFPFASFRQMGYPHIDWPPPCVSPAPGEWGPTLAETAAKAGSPGRVMAPLSQFADVFLRLGALSQLPSKWFKEGGSSIYPPREPGSQTTPSKPPTKG